MTDLARARRSNTAFAAVGAGLVLLVAARGADEQIEERLQFADGLFARGMFKLAAGEYEGLLKESPDGPGADAATFRLGECYRGLNRIPDAERAFRTVYTKFPQSPYRLRAGYKRATLFVDTGQFEAAVELFDRVLKDKPPAEIEAAALFFKADALARMERIEDAAGLLRRVVDRHAGDRYHAYALLKLGQIEAVNRGRPAKALPLFEQAIEAAGTDRVRAEALFQAAEVHFRAGAFDKSAGRYEELLNRYPRDARSIEARLQAAWAAHHAGLYNEALQRADEALAQGEADGMAAGKRAEWLYLKANCERQLVKSKEAIATYARLVGEYPRSRFVNAARYEKAVTFYRMGM
jgi:tetratricopeptide (TPR) repeat protein